MLSFETVKSVQFLLFCCLFPQWKIIICGTPPCHVHSDLLSIIQHSYENRLVLHFKILHLLLFH